ncbi:MAG: hypothetical protein GC204_14425 [Chloroflexi bacterium]|nr:hypothetical protein [Chloroflexota bacterium]
MITRPFPKHALIAVLLAFFAFFMSALVSQTVFERLPHLEDEMAYLFQARTYAGGNLVISTPEPRRAYWQPFLIDQGGERFGKYTPGWPMQLAIGVLLGQTWIINAFYAALTVALVYRLGREIFNADVGVIAAALTAFSPMALLLDGTLMGHTAALFAATLFLYAYWRIERGKRLLLWGAAAGIALGLLVANRPISGIAIAAPLILWSAIRLLRGLLQRRQVAHGNIVDDVGPQADMPSLPMTEASLQLEQPATPPDEIARRRFVPRVNVPISGFVPTLAPLAILSLFTLLIASIVPINNYVAVGSPTKDLYTLVWSYDQIGFGPCCGRSGHTLEKGIRQARFDLSLTASDLFGWQIGSMTDASGTVNPDISNHLLTQANYWIELGVSWILLPFAFLVAYRRKAIFIVIWVAAALGWVEFALNFQHGTLMQNPQFSWAWIITALIWLYLPLFFWRDRMRAWTWILWSAAIGLVVMQMAYWIGSQLYSTRYFYEGLTSIAIISALPLAWLARRISRPLIYGLLALALAYSMYFYSIPRISVLHGFNFINQTRIDDALARRTGDQPVLVLIDGASVRWRAIGPFMALTSPYLNSDVVGAWNYEGTDGKVRQQILDRFPDRQVIELDGADNYAWFPDQPPPPEVANLK